MTQWLRLDSFKPVAPPAKAADLVLDVVVSPYQIPEAVRGFRTGDNRFRIEFRYIDGPEPAGHEVKIDEAVTGIAGRFSGRLLALEIDVKAANARTFGLMISSASEPKPVYDWAHGLQAALASIPEKTSQAGSELAHFQRSVAALRDRESGLFQQLAIAGQLVR